ncbi:hypothetical protein [Cryobacterium sp. TMT3-29-2]|uniref:hypothetical protein n=1 Tax=Cryobacterium sp. TMT3-29-2 TaxID=2555867 RepID=UPI00107411A3|nr:hypothetical protein [Cryobacterium sp. TMT3-29-2]TFC85335.1 hypothetical protein E3O67_11840 [Cryobacterium sp. TMT3-29-2]
MARTKLTQLLGDPKPEAVQAVVQVPVPTEPAPAPATEPEPVPTPARATRVVTKLKEPIGASDVGGGAHYLSFVRKETRLRGDQMDALAAKARQINRNKTDGGERITDNTLIRIAVDLLLARADKLAGSTEDQLRNSVSS